MAKKALKIKAKPKSRSTVRVDISILPTVRKKNVTKSHPGCTRHKDTME